MNKYYKYYKILDAGVKEKDIKRNVKNQIVELVELVLENGLEVAQLSEVLNVIIIGKLGELVLIKYFY
jgi:hypothetical protein